MSYVYLALFLVWLFGIGIGYPMLSASRPANATEKEALLAAVLWPLLLLLVLLDVRR